MPETTAATGPAAPVRPSRRRRSWQRRVVTAVVATVALLVATAALGFWVFAGHEQWTASRYDRQVRAVHLGRQFHRVRAEHGGTYFAAGNGPYASVTYRTELSQDEASAKVTSMLRGAGYSVGPDREHDALPGLHDSVLHLTAARHGRPLHVLIGPGAIYDLPYGYADATSSGTNVLLVVKDEGRTR